MARSTREETSENPQSSHELAVESIYEALVQLMEIKPYEEISITDICKRAGVSRMAYYRNYGSKDEILTRRLDEKLARFTELSRERRFDAEEDFWEAFFEAFREDPVIANMVRAGLFKQLMEAHLLFTMRTYEDVLHRDMHDEHNRMLAYKNMGLVTGLMLYGIRSDTPLGPRELAREVVTSQEAWRPGKQGSRTSSG